MFISIKSLDRRLLLAALLVGCCARSALAGGYDEAVMSANPTAFFRLNDTSGATAANTVASPAVTGTYFNSWATAGNPTTMLSGGTASTSPSPTLMQAGPNLPGFASGNYSVFFEGFGYASTNSDSLRISAPTATFGNDYTMQFWFRNTRPVSSQLITGYLGQRVGDSQVVGIWGNYNAEGGTASDAGKIFTSRSGVNAAFGTGFLTATNTW